MICHDTFYTGRFETTGYDIFMIDTGHERALMVWDETFHAAVTLKGVIFGKTRHGRERKHILLCKAPSITYIGVAKNGGVFSFFFLGLSITTD